MARSNVLKASLCRTTLAGLTTLRSSCGLWSSQMPMDNSEIHQMIARKAGTSAMFWTAVSSKGAHLLAQSTGSSGIHKYWFAHPISHSSRLLTRAFPTNSLERMETTSTAKMAGSGTLVTEPAYTLAYLLQYQSRFKNLNHWVRQQLPKSHQPFRQHKG